MEENQVHIPDGWVLNELSNLIIEKRKSSLKVSDATNYGNFPFFTSGETILKHTNKQIDGQNIFLATGGVANIKYYDGEASYSTDTYAITSKNEIDTEYLYFDLLNILYYINANYFQGSGLKHLQKKDLKKHQILFPKSLTEQTQIATILSKVDEAITQTEQLIAKYTRIKTGLMQDLLTKGIDENGNIRSEATHEFKDSPLGRIPKEWECDWLGNIAKIQTGSKDTQDKDDTGQYPFYVRSQIVERINSYSFDGEGILTAGDGVGVGKVFHYVNGKFDFHQRVYLIHEFRKDIIGKFIFLYFKENFIKQVDKYSAKNTVDSVRLHMIFEMDVPVLKFSEQKRIVEILDKNDSLVEYLEQELSKLKSLKTGLMQDLLSGKVRVNHLIKETASV